MGSLSNYAETALINHLVGTAYTPAATIYLALCTADPTEAATGASMNEAADANGYTRKAIAFSAASSRRVTQNGVVTYDQASGSWGTISHWAIVDTATHGAGNVLAYGAFATPKAVVSGNTLSVANTTLYVEITAGSGFTDYLAHALLDRMFRNQAFTQPATYVALSTTTPTDAGGNVTEPSGNNYSRVLVNVVGGASPAWDTVANGATQNANAISMPTASGSWGTITYALLYDASGAGNALLFGTVTSQAVGDGDTVSFAIGAFDISQS